MLKDPMFQHSQLEQQTLETADDEEEETEEEAIEGKTISFNKEQQQIEQQNNRNGCLKSAGATMFAL